MHASACDAASNHMIESSMPRGTKRATAPVLLAVVLDAFRIQQLALYLGSSLQRCQDVMAGRLFNFGA